MIDLDFSLFYLKKEKGEKNMNIIKRGITVAVATLMLGSTMTSYTMAKDNCNTCIKNQIKEEYQYNDLRQYEGYKATVKLFSLENQQIAEIKTTVKNGTLGLDFLVGYDLRSVEVNKVGKKEIEVKIVIDKNYNKMIQSLLKLVEEFKKKSDTKKTDYTDYYDYDFSFETEKEVEDKKVQKSDLDTAKEKALAELSQEGVTSEFFLKQIKNAKTKEGVEALKNELIQSHKQSIEEKFLNEISNFRLNKNIVESIKDIFVKSEKEQRLEKARTDALTNLRDQGITSEFLLKAVEKAKTIEGVNSLKDELIKSHKESKAENKYTSVEDDSEVTATDGATNKENKTDETKNN